MADEKIPASFEVALDREQAGRLRVYLETGYTRIVYESPKEKQVIYRLRGEKDPSGVISEGSVLWTEREGTRVIAMGLTINALERMIQAIKGEQEK